MIQHPCPKKGICFTQRAEGQLLYYCVPRAPWNTMLRRCIFLFEVFGSTSNRSSTLYLRGAGGETTLRTAIPFFGQQCQINTQADYNEQVCLLLLSGDRANTYWPLNALTKLRYMHTRRGPECLCGTLRCLQCTLSWQDTEQLILCAPLRETLCKTQIYMCFYERLRRRHRKHSVLVKDSDSEKKLILE
jgi:hypothetical protein